MNKREGIAIYVLLCFFSVLLLTAHLAHAQEKKSTRINNPARAKTLIKPQAHTARVIATGGRTFRIVNQGNDPVAATFNECVNAAKETCTNGVENVDHEEDTGNCGFSCMAAP